MIRAISGWATAAMLGLAATALVYLVIAFVPLADLWAAHHPGQRASAAAAAIRLSAWAALALAGAVAAVATGGWAGRARANLEAFGVRSRRIAHGSVGRSPALRRRMTALVWLLRGSLLAGCAAALLGWLAGQDNAAEIGDVRAQAAAGRPVDGALAADLFGRQLVLRLPAAALFVIAAAVAVVLVARVTSAQYGRVARLRGAAEAPDPARRSFVLRGGGTIGA
ncbi:hypothetical protein [Dactylosporangium sp. CA-092794]|uniref:hypothetical protein n=1 Tax=Dactylosporangium sp. CA-092794 TaxID=3239929 RepID=UPI003D94CF66